MQSGSSEPPSDAVTYAGSGEPDGRRSRPNENPRVREEKEETSADVGKRRTCASQRGP